MQSDTPDWTWFEEIARWIESSLHSRIKAKKFLRPASERGYAALVEIDLMTRPSVVLHLSHLNHSRERKITTILGAMPSIGDDRHGYVPRVIFVHPSWNAWLSEGYALPARAGGMTFVHTTSLLTRAATSLARLQCGTVSEVSRLKRAGAADLTPANLRRRSLELFELIARSRRVQNHPLHNNFSLGNKSNQSLRELFDRVFDAMERLQLPETILHPGLRPHSIAIRGNCQFLDWWQGSIGSCGLGLEDLLLLNQGGTLKEREALNRWLRMRYAEQWANYGGLELGKLVEATEYGPLLAAFGSLLQHISFERLAQCGNNQSTSRLISRLDRTAIQLSMSLTKKRSIYSAAKTTPKLCDVA